MSYSFSVRAANKAFAMSEVSQKLADVVSAQPVHATDELLALHAAQEFIGLLDVDETKDVAVSMNGSIWKAETGVRSASITVSVNLVDKEKAAG